MGKDRLTSTKLGARIAKAREHAGLSQTELGRRNGVTRSAVSQWESGTTEPTAERLRAIAIHTGANYEWLATNRSPEFSEDAPEQTVPLKGYVAAGSQAHFLPLDDSEFDRVTAPPGSTPNTVALEIRGTSLGELFDRWLVFFDQVRAPVTPDLIGRLCVVGLADGRVLVKKIRRGRNGLFDLLSNTEEPITDATVEWAARVKIMAPR